MQRFRREAFRTLFGTNLQIALIRSVTTIVLDSLHSLRVLCVLRVKKIGLIALQGFNGRVALGARKNPLRAAGRREGHDRCCTRASR
jgi:hypothetical protein